MRHFEETWEYWVVWHCTGRILAIIYSTYSPYSFRYIVCLSNCLTFRRRNLNVARRAIIAATTDTALHCTALHWLQHLSPSTQGPALVYGAVGLSLPDTELKWHKHRDASELLATPVYTVYPSPSPPQLGPGIESESHGHIKVYSQQNHTHIYNLKAHTSILRLMQHKGVFT